MTPQDITFAFKGDKAFAIREGKVIATSHVDYLGDLEKVAFGHDQMGQPPMGGDPSGAPTEMPPLPGGMGDHTDPNSYHDGPCLNCGTPVPPGEEICPECGTPVDGGGGNPWAGHVPGDHGPMDSDPYDSEPGIRPMGHITTPNGLKGKVLGKVAGLWQDEVTVRLENGRIVHLPVSKQMTFERTAKSKTSTNPVERLEQRLASSVDGSRESLVARRDELESTIHEGRTIIAGGVSDRDARAIDQIVVTSDAELAEVNEAIDHLDDAETQAYAPPAPFSMGPAAPGETAVSMGGKDGSWLDEVTNDLIAEAEATDFKQLMDEGPEALTAELETPALADAGVVRQMASSYIRSKTAGTDPAVRDPYERTFLARIEECRRVELGNRKQTTHKEAAVQEDQFKDAPDESLFL